MVPILIGVLIITWIFSHMIDKNPYMSQILTYDRQFIERELRRVGWYKPWYEKLRLYLKNFFTGDWGESHFMYPGEKVVDIIGRVFPRSFELMIFSLIIVPIIGIKLGISSARNKNKSKDYLIRGMAIIGAGFPVFYVASLLQIFVGFTLKDFTYGGLDIPVVFANNPSLTRPVPGGGPSTGFRLIDSILYNDQIFFFDTLLHLVVPVFCMTLISLSSITRQTRSSMLEVLDKDYIRTARAKGVKERDVINNHALRNGILPSSHLIIGGIATSLTGSVFVEVTFSYTGMGYYFYSSIMLADYFLINGFVVFFTLIIISGTLIADIVYTIIDPRIVY
jgi:peptide/nickel transport system permease protein